MHKIVERDNPLGLMKAGIDQIADTVKPTLGVNGRNVVLDTDPMLEPLTTNDGVTIARDLIIDGEVQNVGAKYIRKAAETTHDNAGDGTTTSMILMQAIVNRGLKALAAGADPIAMRKGIKKAVDSIVKYLDEHKTVVDKDEKALAATATISCRDAEIGELVAEVAIGAGKDGMVSIEDSTDNKTTIEKLEGIRLRGGLLHNFFVNQPSRAQAIFNDVPILVTNQTLTTTQEMVRVMEIVSGMGKKEAVIIANGVDGDALRNCIINWQRQLIRILPIRVITYGDLGEGMLRDVASITGAPYIDQNHERNLLEITEQDFGLVQKIVSDKNYTTVISDNEELKENRIIELKAAEKDAKAYEAENIRERIAKLQSAMYTIKVGGNTDAEREELKTRVDDAVKSARAAFNDGVIAGGGSALYRASLYAKSVELEAPEDESIGYQAVVDACQAPIEQLAINSSYRLDKHDLKELESDKKSLDFSSCQIVNAFDSGIIDPVKVVRESIINGASQAGLFLTVHAVVVTKEEQNDGSRL